MEKHVHVIEWPTNAPDLNPMENLWALWKRNVDFQDIRNKDQLWDAAVNSWNGIRQDPDLVNSLIESLPRRIAEVIQNHGDFSSY